MSTMPTYTYTLSNLPSGDVVADCIDASGDFMAWHARIRKSRPETFFHQDVAVTNAARFDLHTHFAFWGSGISRSTNSKSPPGLLICAAFIFSPINVPLPYQY